MFASAVDHDAGPGAGVAAVIEDDLAVDDDGGDADGVLERIGERRAVGDGGRVEEHEVGGVAVLDEAAVRRCAAATR